MISALVMLYSLYIGMRMYISVMQIGFIRDHQEPVLLDAQTYREAASYAISKERLAIIEALVEWILFMFWMGGAIAWLDQTLMGYALQSILALMGMIIISTIVQLPFGWWSKFKIDARYGFNRSTPKQFMKDTLISMVLTLVVGSALAWIMTQIIQSSPQWWLVSFGVMFGVVIVLNMLFPTIRALFFDRVSPLDNPTLHQKIENLMHQTGFESQGIFVSDASKRDARLNAYFGGLGKSKRVVLFDTLIQKLTDEELIAVLGHELGHFAHGDLYKNIAFIGAMLFGMFAFFGNIPDTLYLELGVADSPHIVMMLFVLLLPMVSFWVMPLMGLMSRHNEYEADKMGSELGGALYLRNALKKLVSENKSFPLSHPLYRFFYTTHPPVLDRLRALGEAI